MKENQDSWVDPVKSLNNEYCTYQQQPVVILHRLALAYEYYLSRYRGKCRFALK